VVRKAIDAAPPSGELRPGSGRAGGSAGGRRRGAAGRLR
jgi:hypothetical protein